MNLHGLVPRRVLLGAGVMVLATVLDSAAAYGWTLMWSVNAMACVPTASTVRNGLLETSHGNARYAEGKTGYAYLVCPFTDATWHDTVVTGLEITRREPSGTSVAASLKVIEKQSGQVFAVLASDGSCVTDSSQLGNPYIVWLCGGGTGHRLDFQRYSYYVQLSLYRGSTSADARVVSAGLYCDSCTPAGPPAGQ